MSNEYIQYCCKNYNSIFDIMGEERKISKRMGVANFKIPL
jgi:hypothetical protein